MGQRVIMIFGGCSSYKLTPEQRKHEAMVRAEVYGQLNMTQEQKDDLKRSKQFRMRRGRRN